MEVHDRPASQVTQSGSGMICGTRKGHKELENVIRGRDWEWVWERVEFPPVNKKGKLWEIF